jgi:ubiquinone/menaquinone biosynthesis C-methylase UbiE
MTGDVIGIDLAEEMARAANEEAARRGLAARVRVMDAERLAFPDACFDRVLCGFGIMFFPDQLHALDEFRRVLKPGGRIGVSTWHRHQNSELEAALIELGIQPPRQPGWITEAADLASLFTRAGFTDARVDIDEQSFRYSDVDVYWHQARSTGMRRFLDALDAAQSDRLRAALAMRMERQRRPDGVWLAASALIGVARR